MHGRTSQLLAGLAALLVITGCSSTEIVYRDRAPFNTAPDVASGLLGYYNVSSKQTTCGNCHAGHQANWATTHHSDAFNTLASSGHASSSCYSCHTVSQNGNGITTAAGWNATPDSGYKDVQCESCHGPGTEHVKKTEDRSKWPLARLTLSKASASCASCHTGIHTPFAEQWAVSGHSKLESPAVNNTTSNCRNCHEGKTALASWGVVTNYQERDSASVFSPATCAVCHDPHGGTGNDHQLRFPINTPDLDKNLCMKCHLNRGAPTASSATPHGAAGYTLVGISGYRPAGVSLDTSVVLTTHGSTANPRLCAGCHVNAYDVTDPATGSFVFHSTGHDFRPLPCLQANGQPDTVTTCAYSATARSFKACTASGCHGTAAVAASLLSTSRNNINSMANTIWLDLNGNNKVDAAPTDGGYLATVMKNTPAELSTTNPVLTPAKGAQFNVLLFAERNYGHGDNSFGVHNPILAKTLLAANINELRTAYGLPAPPAPVQALVTESINAAKVRSPAFIREMPVKQ